MSVIYLDHFGLRRAPFGSAPEPALFHHSPSHQQVLDWIVRRVAAGAPMLVLTGEEGIGKTTLLRLLRDRQGGDRTVALVAALLSQPGGVLLQARDAFGLSAERDSPSSAADQIRRFAEYRQAQGGGLLLMVDDAQALGVEGLAALQSLAMERHPGGALTLLLAGRPELRTLLNAPELAALRTAQDAHAVLPPLGSGETAAYVAHRLELAGAREPIFKPDALQVLNYFGLGVPRLINIMAGHCLMTAAADGVSELEGPWVGAVLHEASAAGVLSQLEELAAAEGLASAPAHAAAQPETAAQLVDSPPAATEPKGEQPPAPAASERPQLKSDALRHVRSANPALRDHAPTPVHGPADDPKLHPNPRPRRRAGLWLPTAAALLVLGAGMVWFQPRDAGLAPLGPATQPAATSAAPSRTALPEPVAVTPEPTVAALMQHALEVEATDPAGAALAYARAALRGRARAAWYLGQMHETGSGLPPAPGMARLWYAAAADLPAAQRRLRVLSADAPEGTPPPPVPVFHARLDSGGSEMIWQLRDGAVPARFRVELAGPAGEPLPIVETAVPGLIVPFAVSAWRVTAIGADGSESESSAMVRMIPAED